MNRIIISLLQATVLTFALISSVFACSCGGENAAFCRNVHMGDNVVLVEVTGMPAYETMEVQRLETLADTVNLNAFSILGQDGFNCGEGLGDFAIGDTLLLSLYDNGWDSIHDYYLDGCGRHYLKYEGGLLTGTLNDSVVDIPYVDFLEQLQECLDLKMGLNATEKGPDISTFPNPCGDWVNIEAKEGKITEVQLLDINGKLIVKKEMNTKMDRLNFPEHSPGGIYFLSIQIGDQLIVKKIIRQ